MINDQWAYNPVMSFPSGTLRPHRSLLTYYVFTSLLLGPLFPLALVPLFFRYETLRYQFDGEGVSMRWGILFRREISLTYSRIQDIHLSSNILERWLGLAKVQVQTASGSSKAEMTIEGIREYEAIRDFLYSKMRGAASQRGGTGAAGVKGEPDAVAAVLREVAAEVRALRSELAGRDPHA